MRTVLLKYRNVLQSRDYPSTFCMVFLIVHGVPRVSCDWRRWWRNFAQGTFVADSGSLGRCTRTCQTRVMEGFLHMHASPAPTSASHWAQLETLLSQLQLARG